MPLRSPLRPLLAGLVVASLAAAPALPAAAAPAPAPAVRAAASDFYTPPATLPPANGDVVRAEASVFYLDPLHALRAPADVRRIMYRSTDTSGAAVAVTGVTLVPRTAWRGSGARPLVAFAAGTQGLADDCAPSRQLAGGTEYEGVFIGAMLARGYAVVVTDYQGLGTPGEHTYVAREATAHAVLDSVRAAQRSGTPGIAAGGPVALTGFSQGGGASAAAVELAPAYAPELDIRGAYAGGIPSQLGAVAAHLDGTLFFGFALYAVSGLAAAYGLDLGAILNARGLAAVAGVRTQCTVATVASYPFVRSATLTRSGATFEALLDTEPWRSVAVAQRIGLQRPGAPVLVAQSLFDDVIPYAQGRQVARDWCARGARVQFTTYWSPTHVATALATFPQAYDFLADRFAGRTSSGNCGSF